MLTTSQIQASQKAQLSQWFAWADKTLDDAEKLFDLQLSTCRSALQDMARSCQGACDVRDMPAVLSWQSAVCKPLAEHSVQYGARLMGLASQAGRELGRSFENQWQEMNRQMGGWLGQMPATARPGPDAAFEYLRNTMNAFDSVWASTRQQLSQAQQQVVTSGATPRAWPARRESNPRPTA
jgi:phasin family protein